MRLSSLLGTTLALTAGLGAVVAPLTRAVQLSDGRVLFTAPPRLMSATTTFKRIRTFGATYYFTVNLPEDAGEPLGQVTINERRGFDDIRFRLDETRVFEGTRHNKGDRLGVAAVTEDEEGETITVKFDSPVEPGTTVTVGLRPIRNPDVAGVYLFGVTAFPAGEQPEGMYLGVGRLQFYNRSDGDFFHD